MNMIQLVISPSYMDSESEIVQISHQPLIYIYVNWRISSEKNKLNSFIFILWQLVVKHITYVLNIFRISIISIIKNLNNFNIGRDFYLPVESKSEFVQFIPLKSTPIYNVCIVQVVIFFDSQ